MSIGSGRRIAPLFKLNVSWHKLCLCLLCDEGNFCQNEGVSTSSSFYICFLSLLINMRLVFISYFVSVLLRKGYRVFEYKCSFLCLYLFLFAFLIICIETSCFHRLFCIETFGFRRLFCNITSVLWKDWSPVWYPHLLGLWRVIKW